MDDILLRTHRLADEDFIGSVAFWRRMGRRIVTVNGCFDIPTAGHMRILREAQKLSGKHGGLVICGLNSDASVRALKGAGRPVVPEDQRALFLLSSGFVDVVCIYEQETSEEFVRACKPDIHVNDESYGMDCVEARVMKDSLGFMLVLVPKVECLSTTEILMRARGNGE